MRNAHSPKKTQLCTCETCSKLMIKTPEGHHWCHFGVFIVKFEHILHLVLDFLLLTLNNVSLVLNICSILLKPKITFETVSSFIEAKLGIAFTIGNIYVAIEALLTTLSFFAPVRHVIYSIQSYAWHWCDCTWTKLDSNGFNLNSAEGRPLVPFLH